VVLGDVNRWHRRCGRGEFLVEPASVLLGPGHDCAPGRQAGCGWREPGVRSRRRRVTPLAMCAWTACRGHYRVRSGCVGGPPHQRDLLSCSAASGLEQPQSTALAPGASRGYGWCRLAAVEPHLHDSQYGREDLRRGAAITAPAPRCSRWRRRRARWSARPAQRPCR
jgi:hypothetical protein